MCLSAETTSESQWSDLLAWPALTRIVLTVRATRMCASSATSFTLTLMASASVNIGLALEKCSDVNALARPVYSEYFSMQCLIPHYSCNTLIESHYKNKPFIKCDNCTAGFMHLDQCVTSCPAGYYARSNNFCVCSGVANLTVGDQCLNQTACPIGMYFDQKSFSCLSCPFGCLSCFERHCTACNPGYFLYLSPQIIFCRRKSPLFPCDTQYSWQRNTTCLVQKYNEPELQMTLCVNQVANCQVCIPRST